MSPAAVDNTKEKKSKFRLSNPFGSKTHKEDVIQEEQRPTDNNATASNLNVPSGDSAYGGSEPTNITPGSSTAQVPTVTEAQAAAQDAPIKTQTDRATGRTITTTTTTTTTTVTTTDGDHYQVPPGSEVVVDNSTASENNNQLPLNANEPTELSARPISRDRSRENLRFSNPSSEQGPPIPPKDNHRTHSPAVQPVTAAASSSNYSSTYDPVSPEDPRPAQGQNFSYPSRTPPANSAQPLQTHYRTNSGTGYQAYQPQSVQRYPSTATDNLRPPDSAGVVLPPAETQTPGLWGYGREREKLRPDGKPSTLSNLKTAAAGIHGASEALRGALNSSIERHTGGDPAIIAAHDGVAAKGRHEVETGRFFREPTSPYTSTGAAAAPQKTSPTSPQFIRNSNNPPASPGFAPPGTYGSGSGGGAGWGAVGGGQADVNPQSQAAGVQSLNSAQHAQALEGPVGGAEENGGKVKRKGLKNVLRKSKEG